MPNFLPEVAAPQFPAIYQLEENDPVQGGPDGIDNLPHSQLAERTAFLNGRADDLEIALDLLKAEVDGLNLNSGTALRSAVLLNWLYGDASPTFELWASGFSWRDLAPIKVTQATAGDDTLDLATTEGLLQNRTYVLLDAAGNTLEILEVANILTATRLRTRLNLGHTLSAVDGAYLARTSAAISDGYATFSPGDVYYSRVITELATQPGGQLVLRRSAIGTGVFTVSFRVFGSTPWAQAPLTSTVSRGGDTRDETYTFAVGGQIEVRITYAGPAAERVEHMVILPPAAIDKTPLVSRPLNVTPADQAFNVGQTPTLTGSAFLSLYGLAQAGAEFRVARNPTMSDLVVSSSADFLASWVTVSGQSTPFADLVATGPKAYTLVANGVSLRTTDGGLTFTPGTVTGELRRVHANAGLLVAVGAAGAIRTSTDNGLTYTTRATANGYAGIFSGVVVRGAFVVAVGDGGTIQRSINGGAIFGAIGADAGYTGTFNSLAGDGTGKLIAVGTNGEIQTSADDGQTWTHRNAPNGYTGAYQRVRMDASGFAVAVGANGAIHTSADAGATWTARTPAASFAGTFYGVSHRGLLVVAVGSGGEIQTSKDGGATWTHRAAGGGATGTFRAVSLDADAYGLAIGDGGLVQRTLKLDAATSTFTVPAGVDFLAVNTVYWWQLRYFDAAGNASPWSAPTAFATSTAFNYVAAPQNLAPAAGDLGVSLLPQLQSSAFRAVGAADTHTRSQWQVSTSPTFASVFYDSGETTDLLSHQVAAGGILTTQQQYFWRVRHKGTTLGYGAWSEPTAFTAQARPDRPAIIAPTDGAAGVALAPTIRVSPFVMSGGGVQAAVQVQLSLTASFASIFLDSGDVTGSAYAVPAGKLSFAGSYFARARYKETGGAYSAWSPVVGFRVTADTQITSSFAAVVFTGNASPRSIVTGISNNASDGRYNLLWFKGLAGNLSHVLAGPSFGDSYFSFDRPVGYFGQYSTSYVTSFDAAGVSIGNDPTMNPAGVPTILYNFGERAKFFDFIGRMGNNNEFTKVPHNIGGEVGLILYKQIGGNAQQDWYVWHRSIGLLGRYLLKLNADTVQPVDYTVWGEVTDAYFTIGTTQSPANGSPGEALPNRGGQAIACLVFGHDESASGVIRCEKAVIGTNTVGNSFVLPWDVQWVLAKRIDVGGTDWIIADTARASGASDLAMNTSAGPINPGPVSISGPNVVLSGGPGATWLITAIRAAGA